MSKNSFWYGYLEAGDKSSAVLGDPDLDTGNRKTMFLFNLARNQILEYNREIVEPKLRELRSGEEELAKGLDKAYDSARRSFAAARRNLSSVPESGPAPRAAAAARNTEQYEDYQEFEEDLETEPLDEEEDEETA